MSQNFLSVLASYFNFHTILDFEQYYLAIAFCRQSIQLINL
jgi:hypothetical protein